MCLKGEVQRDLGDVVSSVASYRSALAASPDGRSQCQAQIGLAEGLVRVFLTSVAPLDSAQRTAEQYDMIAELARIHHLRNIFFTLGNIQGCTEQHKRSFSYAKRMKSPEAEARALGGLADAAYAQGRMRSAFEHFHRCVALSREHGFGRIEVANRSMVGFSRLYLNEAKLAGRMVRPVRAASLVGQPRAETIGEHLGMIANYELGDFESMEGHLARTMQLARQLGARSFEAVALEMKARMLLDTGRRKEAADMLQEALAILREVVHSFSGRKLPVLWLGPSRMLNPAPLF
jgi:tetratricopeptide (TPR) repeat protein